MSEENNTPTKPQNRKRKVLFIIGLLVGLLLGGVLTMLLMDLLDYEHPTVVKVLEHSAPAGTKDTVVNYVIHKYESQDGANRETQDADTLMVDSSEFNEDYQDYMLDEEDLKELKTAKESPQSVMEDKMLKKSMLKITYLDGNKHVVAAPSNAPVQCQIQQWSTPIKNRLSYQFSNNVLRVKGLDIDNVKLVHYDDHYYMLAGNHVYLVNPNKQYDKMLEASDMSFPLR